MPRQKTLSIKKNKSIAPKNSSFSERLNEDVSTRQSTLSFILGILIVVVLGVLIFNFFTRSKNNLSNATTNPGQITQQAANTTPEMKKDTSGKYTVKPGDTLFTIAEKYYNDGYQYPKIVKANKIADENIIDVGQEINIPTSNTTASAPTPAPSTNGITTAKLASQDNSSDNGTGGATNQTIWGERITSDTYTVQAGDWLSKIAGRAYGDIYAFDKIAKANNISNPDKIEPGTVIKIPR